MPVLQDMLHEREVLFHRGVRPEAKADSTWQYIKQVAVAGRGGGVTQEAASQVQDTAEFERLMEALARIRARLQGLIEARGVSLEARFETLAMLDDQARDVILRLGRSGAMSGSLGEPRARRLVGEGRDLFGGFLDAFHACLDGRDPEAARPALRRTGDCRVRLACSAADRVVWERFAGGPPHPHLWVWLGRVFDEAVESARPASAVSLGPVGHCASSVEREFVRALAAHAAALDLAPAVLVLPFRRLLDFVLPMLRLERTPLAGVVSSVVPGEAVGPRRIVRPPAGEGAAWYFSPGLAIGALEEIAARISVGDVPARLASGEPGEASLSSAIAHLVRHWSASHPVRRHRRYLLDGPLTAVRGFEHMKGMLGGGGNGAECVWSMRDVSRGGFAAYVAPGAGSDIRIGELVAVRGGGSAWQLALVRRSWAEADRGLLVGLETISRRPMRASVDDGRVRTEVLLCDPPMRGEALRLAASKGAIRPGAPLFLTNGGGVLKLKPLDASISGEGFELRVYQVL